MGRLLTLIVLLAMVGCASGPHYKIYTQNTMKQVVMPDDYNADSKQCGDWAIQVEYSKMKFMDVKLGEKVKNKWQECMEKKGWVE